MQLTTCLGCGKKDDHPKHTISQGDIDIVWHNDCHSRATQCEPCTAIAESGLQGSELRAHIETNDPGGKVLTEGSTSDG